MLPVLMGCPPKRWLLLASFGTRGEAGIGLFTWDVIIREIPCSQKTGSKEEKHSQRFVVDVFLLSCGSNPSRMWGEVRCITKLIHLPSFLEVLQLLVMFFYETTRLLPKPNRSVIVCLRRISEYIAVEQSPINKILELKLKIRMSDNVKKYLRCEVIMAPKTSMTVFWDETACRLVGGCQRFGGTHRLHLQGWTLWTTRKIFWR